MGVEVQNLISFINNLKIDGKIISYDEAATKQAIILKLLSLLSWDTFNIDEVKPEFSIGGNRVDYSLRINNANKVFIEVKKIGEELENHQEQLLKYSFQEGVRLAILTNGITWWFYLPLHEGSWEQRKFYTIDISQQESEDVVQNFFDFLLKDNVINGKAIQNAETVYKGQQKSSIIQETLPKAWNKIINEPDDLLVELINETTEKLCGHKADIESVAEFLLQHKNQFLLSTSTIQPTKRGTIVKKRNDVSTTVAQNENYTGKTITAFYFRGKKYEVRSWIVLLIKLSEELNNKHKNEFNKTLNLSGRKRPYFSYNKNELRVPQQIDNTKIFVETNLSANMIVKMCGNLLALFGYSSHDLKIDWK
jgi:predicted type IV restriction endonuclease